MSDLLRILAVLGLVAGNAFFVIGEYAVVTARRAALQDRRGSAAALRLMDDPVRVISTVQVGITAIGILAGALAEPLVRGLIGDALPGWATYVLAFAIVTYLSVVFGELVPKALTLEKSETLAVLIARPIELISIALRPVVWVLQGSAALVLRPFGIREVTAGESIRNASELRALVDEAEESGVIPRAQEELLHNVFDFPDREARDVMVPALDVCWLDADLTPADAIDRHIETPHTRYPVGRGSLDRLEGIVHVHDLIAAARTGAAETIGPLARPTLIVPETKDIGALMREQRAEGAQLAVVVDEYGAVAGDRDARGRARGAGGRDPGRVRPARRADRAGRGRHRAGRRLDDDRRLQRGDGHAAAAGGAAHARRPRLRRARPPPRARRHGRVGGGGADRRAGGRPAHHRTAGAAAARPRGRLTAILVNES